MNSRRKLRSEMESAEMDGNEGPIIYIQARLVEKQRDLDCLDSMEDNLKKDIERTEDGLIDVSKVEGFAFDKNFLMKKKITGSDIFEKRNAKKRYNITWKRIPEDIFIENRIHHYVKQLNSQISFSNYKSIAHEKRNNQSRIPIAVKPRKRNMSKQRDDNIGQNLKDKEISAQFNTNTIEKESGNLSADKYEQAGGKQSLEELSRRALTPEDKDSNGYEGDRANYAKTRDGILKASRISSGLSANTDKDNSLFSEKADEIVQKCSSPNDFTVEPAITQDNLCENTSGDISVKNKINKLKSFSTNDFNAKSASIDKKDSSEITLTKRRSTLSLKRELWLQQHQGQPSKVSFETNESKPSLFEHNRKIDTSFSYESGKQGHYDIDSQPLSKINKEEHSLADGKESEIQNEEAADMEVPNDAKEIVVDEVNTVCKIDTQEQENDWFDKLRCLDALVDQCPPIEKQGECDTDEGPSPGVLRKAKSEYDIFSKNSETRGSKRKKVLISKSGHIVRCHLPGLASLQDNNKISFINEKQWLDGLVRAEIEGQEKRRLSSSDNSSPRTPKTPNTSTKNQSEMYFEQKLTSLPRSETIDEESIQISERKEWLSRLMEMEIHGRQETLKKLQKQKSMHVSSGNLSANERRRSLPAGRLVEEYLHRQAVDIVPAYEQPGDFARLSSSGQKQIDKQFVSVGNSHRTLSTSLSHGSEDVSIARYETNNIYKNAKDDEMANVGDIPKDINQNSGNVRNNTEGASSFLTNQNEPPAFKVILNSSQNKTSSNPTLDSKSCDHVTIPNHIQKTFPGKYNGVMENIPRSSHFSQQRSLDSSMLTSKLEGQEIPIENKITRPFSSGMEVKSSPEIKQEQERQPSRIPSIKEKIAAFRSVEVLSSVESTPKSQNFGEVSLQSQKCNESKNADVHKNIEKVLTEINPNSSESKPGKFHIHQNSTVVRRALDIATSDSVEKREKVLYQQCTNENDDIVHTDHKIEATGITKEPSGLILARDGKKFWESMANTNTNNSRYRNAMKKMEGPEVALNNKDTNSEGREAKMSLAHDIGMAILGYDETSSPNGIDTISSTDASYTATDTDSDDEDYEYLKLVQDNRIKKEIEEQKLREQEIKRINKGKHGNIRNKTPDISIPSDQENNTTRKVFPNKLNEKQSYFVKDPNRGSENIGRIPSEAKNSGKSRKNIVTKVQESKQQSVLSQNNNRLDAVERNSSGFPKSALLQREEEEERRRQLEFEEEKRQRMEERQKQEEEDREKQRQMEIERKRKEEAEAERLRILKEKKLEGKRKTHSLRALFEKVC